MIDFSLSQEERAVRDTIRQFIQQEVMPLEDQVLRNERAGLPPLEAGQLAELQLKAKAGGWWGINTPEEYGGIALGPVMSAIVAMETGRTFVPFRFGGSADNILYAGTDEQKQQYLIPTINGDRRSCFAITEPGAGSDARNIRTRAVKDGGDWVINGEKTFITGGNEADFVMVFAVTDAAKGADGGVTCFLVDRDMGWKSEPIPTMGEWGPAVPGVRGRPRPGAEHPGRARARLHARHAVDRQRALHDPRPGDRVGRTAARHGDRAREEPGLDGAPDRRLPGDPVADRRLARRDRGGQVAHPARRLAAAERD